MRKPYFLLLFMLLTFSSAAKAQTALKLQAGYGYQEHFSTGAIFHFAGKHNLSLLYGSDFFVKPAEFSTVMLQYDLEFHKLKKGNFIPKAGCKAGYTIYTNETYQWQVFSVIPQIGTQWPINNKIDLLLEAGAAISFEIGAKRISYHEIGYYKKILPEVKVGLQYTIFRRST